jgi:hypothetical protein
MQTSLLAGILTEWRCASATDCRAPSTLPPGVLPTVSVTAAGLVTVFPAPLDWQRVCTAVATSPAPPVLQNPVLKSMMGSPCTSGVMSTSYTTRLQNAGGVVPAGAMWLPVTVDCVGAGARKRPEEITLGSLAAQSMPPSGFGGPGGGPGQPGNMNSFPMGSSLDSNTIWNPALEDSMNQEAPDTVLNEEWTINPDGYVLHQLHFQADYAMTAVGLTNFPFDNPVIVATRRPFGMSTDDLDFNPVDSGFILPQEMDGWRVLETGLATCLTYDVGLGDPDKMPTACGTPDALGPCRSTAVLWIRLSRAPMYWLQNMLAPITLITILAAASFYNDLDAYDSRMTVMSVSLLSLMALSGYVSAMLPPTEVITYIHYALYTSYALMGWGIGIIIVVSFLLSADLDHAKKMSPSELKQPVATTDESFTEIRRPWLHQKHLHLRNRILRVHAQQEGEVKLKPWVMRLYYHDALIFKRLLDGTASEADCTQELVYFKADEIQAGRLRELRANGKALAATTITLRSTSLQAEGAEAAALEAAVPEPEAVSEEKALGLTGPPPYCPDRIYLRLLFIEIDCAMRVLHLLIYAFVLLGRYVQIMNIAPEKFDCPDLITYFANADV